MTLRLNLVHLAWDPVSGSTGYDILLDDVKVSRAGPKAKTTKITIPEGAEHKVTIKAQPSGQVQEARFLWRSIVDVPPPPPPSGNPYFISDWDTVNGGLMKWPPWATLFQVGTPSTIDLGLYGGSGISAAANGRAAVVANPYGAGHVLRLEIRNTDPSTGTNNFQKEELGSYEPATWADGSWTSPEEVWVMMEMYLPDEFGLASGGSNPFTNLMDFHPSSNSGVPALGLGGYSTTNLQLYAGIPGSIQRKNFIDLTPANRNRKLTIVIGANIAYTGGWVEAWLDGVNTIPRFNAVTAEASETGPYFKQGLYKETASSFPNGGCVVYFGRTLLGQTKADVS